MTLEWQPVHQRAEQSRGEEACPLSCGVALASGCSGTHLFHMYICDEPEPGSSLNMFRLKAHVSAPSLSLATEATWMTY